MTIANHQTGECSLPDCFCHEAQGVPAVKTVFGHHLDQCSICSCVAEQFPDLELFDHQLCPEGRQLFRNPSTITIPTFEQEWHDAPRWTTRYTELDRLRAVLFDVIDQGYQCEQAGGLARGELTECNLFHPWQFTFHIPETDEENQQRVRFVDEVLRRLRSINTAIAHYWFIRGQHAKEVELLAGMNCDLREMVRVARERVSR